MYLERVPKGEGDIVCLNCGQNYDIDFDGEMYATNRVDKECLNCSKNMEIEIVIQINYYVTMKIKDVN